MTANVPEIVLAALRVKDTILELFVGSRTLDEFRTAPSPKEGVTAVARFTVPENPPRLISVTTATVLDPEFSIIMSGATATVKSGPDTLTVTMNVRVTDPLFAVTVTL